MPKVATKEFTVKGKTERYDVYYSSKDGFRLKGFPEEVYTLSEVRGADYATEGQLYSATEDALRKYHTIISQNKRVILYTIAAPTGKTMNRTDYGTYQGHKDELGHIARQIVNISSLGSGGRFDFGFCFGCRSVLRVDDNGVSYYEVKDFEGDDTAARRKTSKGVNEFEIDWTPEREQFFKMLEAKCDALFYGLMEFFKKPQEQLLLAMDDIANTQKLLG